jgi:hypothetical protein
MRWAFERPAFQQLADAVDIEEGLLRDYVMCVGYR